MQRETESGPPGNSNKLLRKFTLELLTVSTLSTFLTIQRSVNTCSGPHAASFLWLSPHSGGVSNHVHCLKLYPLEKKSSPLPCLVYSGFLNLDTVDTWGQIVLFHRDIPVVSSIPGLYPPDADCTSSPSDNQKCLQTQPNVLWEQGKG